MTLSVVFLILGLITLLIGWNAGNDPVLWVSIASTVLAGVLLAVSYLQERRMRLQTDTGTGYAPSEPASAPSALMPEASVIAEAAEEPAMEMMEEEEEEEEEMMAPTRPSRSSAAKRSPSRPKAKAKSTAKSKPKAKTTAKAKAKSTKSTTKSAAKAKPKAKAKAKSTTRKSTRS